MADAVPEVTRIVPCPDRPEPNLSRNCVLWRTCDGGHLMHAGVCNIDIKLRLYNGYILPLLLYGLDTWSETEAMWQRLDALTNGA